MTDSSSIRDAIAENIEDGKNVNKVDTTEAKKEVPEVEQTKPEPQVEPEKVETFAEKVEAKGLTPEKLEEIYANYNKAYTQRRQKEKEELRGYQTKIKEYEEKLSRVQQPSSQNLNQQRQEIQNEFNAGNLTLEQYTALLNENARMIAREEFNTLHKQKEEESNQNRMLDEFNRIDERFDKKYTDPDSPEFNKINAWLYRQVASQMERALDNYISKHGSSIGFDTGNIAKEFIHEFDSYMDGVVKHRVQQTTQQAQVKANGSQRSTPRGTTSRSVSTGKTDLRSLISDNVG